MNMSVLLVEDDQVTAHILNRLLEGVGMTVERAGGVAEAIQALQAKPALIVLDLMLPDGSGVEVLQVVRSGKLACKVAVVSAASDARLLAEVTSLKPDAVFGKPLNFDDFVDWMSSIFTEDPAVLTKRTQQRDVQQA